MDPAYLCSNPAPPLRRQLWSHYLQRRRAALLPEEKEEEEKEEKEEEEEEEEEKKEEEEEEGLDKDKHFTWQWWIVSRRRDRGIPLLLSLLFQSVLVSILPLAE